VVSAGAQADKDPAAVIIASVLGISPETYQRILPLVLPVWLEIATLILLAYGFAPIAPTAPDN
jgi:hypothetical protein